MPAPWTWDAKPKSKQSLGHKRFGADMYLTIEGLPELTDKRQQKIAQALVITLAQHDVLVSSAMIFTPGTDKEEF